MSIGERIKRRRKALSVSVEELVELTGTSRATFYRWEKGGTEKIPPKALAKIADALHTTVEYLTGGEESSVNLGKINNVIKINPVKVPLFLTPIAAGQPIYADDYIESYVEYPGSEHVDFALRVKGDSMINAGINDGDIVFVRSQPDVENGEIAVVIIDDSATLKRVYKGNGFIQLNSENPKYSPMIFNEQNAYYCKIAGKAIYCLNKVK